MERRKLSSSNGLRGAYDEMKQFRFEGFPGHPELKDFVMHFAPTPLVPAMVTPAARPVVATTAAAVAQ